MGDPDPSDPIHAAETLIAPAPSSALAAPVPSRAPESRAAISSGIVSHPLVGGRYEILGLIGAGGMGSVYRARDVELDELVALKVLRREIADAPSVLERFRREAKLARRVTHRNVARVFDLGEHEGERFLTMELVDGESLGGLVARAGALPVARVVEIASAICAGLAAAHAAGVVHRDLKPDNVLMAKDGRVVVTDFGIARAVSGGGSASDTMGMLLGTPAYMAPEQVDGSDVDARADIYALGALLYELFTGQRAWPGEAPFAVAAARLVSPPPDPRVVRPVLPAAFGELVVRCMARRREDRPASADQIAAELAVLPLPGARPEAAASGATKVAATHASSSNDRSPAGDPAAHARSAPSRDKTVAVLPFRNAGAPGDDYLADELTDDLIDALSMTPGLKVRSRGVVMRLKDRGGDDPRDVGRELGVQVVVEGSVRRAGENVRIGARVIGVDDGFQLWAKRFDRPAEDVLAVNDQVARAIANALTTDLDRPERSGPAAAAAVDLYLRARHEYRKFWPPNQLVAIELFEQAIAAAPGDPMILSGLAMARARLCFFIGKDFDLALEAATRAVAAAPELGEARLALGSVELQLGEAEKAARELAASIARSPGLAEGHASLGRILVEIGAVDQGVARLEAALALDPQVPLACATLARTHALFGRWDQAHELLDRSRETEGDIGYWTTRSRLLLWRRDRARATELLSELPDGDRYAFVPRGILELAALGKKPWERPEYAALSRGPEGGPRRRAFFHQSEAEGWAFLDQPDEALQAVDRATGAGLIDLLWLERCPLFDAMRASPAYPALLARVRARADRILAASV